jgi:ribosome-associated protein
MKIVELTRQPIELFKILKFEGLADSGGGAKVAISEGRVLVNGTVETRKRRQIVHGDTIEFQGIQLQVQCLAAP